MRREVVLVEEKTVIISLHGWDDKLYKETPYESEKQVEEFFNLVVEKYNANDKEFFGVDYDIKENYLAPEKKDIFVFWKTIEKRENPLD